MANLPEPIVVPWTMKPLSSAKTTIERFDDGRLRMAIEHDVLHGVTPEMLVWWFRHVEGDMLLEGKSYPRYRVWHPRDHVALRYARLPPGGPGPGAVFHIHEVLGRNPAFVVDTLTDVTRLDEGGFTHHPNLAGIRFAVMDYTFERVPGGTLYKNSLVAGRRLPPGLRWITRAVVESKFDEAHGRAWLLHNVEEVGNFEFFLPALFAAR